MPTSTRRQAREAAAAAALEAARAPSPSPPEAQPADDDDDDDDDDNVSAPSAAARSGPGPNPGEAPASVRSPEGAPSAKKAARPCGTCGGCRREDDCGACVFCLDKVKFGGARKRKKKCRLRRRNAPTVAMVPPPPAAAAAAAMAPTTNRPYQDDAVLQRLYDSRKERAERERARVERIRARVDARWARKVEEARAEGRLKAQARERAGRLGLDEDLMESAAERALNPALRARALARAGLVPANPMPMPIEDDPPAPPRSPPRTRRRQNPQGERSGRPAGEGADEATGEGDADERRDANDESREERRAASTRPTTGTPDPASHSVLSLPVLSALAALTDEQFEREVELERSRRRQHARAMLRAGLGPDAEAANQAVGLLVAAAERVSGGNKRKRDAAAAVDGAGVNDGDDAAAETGDEAAASSPAGGEPPQQKKKKKRRRRSTRIKPKTSAYRGVSRSEKNWYYEASCKVGGRSRCLGRFGLQADAARAYDEEWRRVKGEDCSFANFETVEEYEAARDEELRRLTPEERERRTKPVDVLTRPKSSAYRGVSFLKEHGCYEAKVRSRNRSRLLGRFGLEADAARARDDERRRVKGADYDGPLLNFRTAEEYEDAKEKELAGLTAEERERRADPDNYSHLSGEAMNERRWRQRLEELRRYKEEFGTFAVGRDTPLAKWVARQRKIYELMKKEELAVDDGTPDPGENEEGPEKEASSSSVGGDGGRRRKKDIKYGYRPLSEAKIRDLEELGFDWTPAAAAKAAKKPAAPAFAPFDDNFEQLKRYKEEHGDTLVPEDYEADSSSNDGDGQRLGLGAWVKHMRRELSNRYSERGDYDVTEEQVEMLRSIGFDTTGTSVKVKERNAAKWNEMLGRLRAYREEFGDCEVPREYPADPKLGRWVNTQRQRCKTTATGSRRKGGIAALEESQLEALREIGFDTSGQCRPRALQKKTSDDKWDAQYQELLAYHATHGHCEVSRSGEDIKSYPRLARWVETQRRFYKRRQKGQETLLTDDRVKKLAVLGFKFKLRNDWDDWFRQLEEFKAEHGHTRVPTGYEGIDKLGLWVKRQREAKKSGDKAWLDDVRIARLDGINFEWAMREPYGWDVRRKNKQEQSQSVALTTGPCQDQATDSSGYVDFQI